MTDSNMKLFLLLVILAAMVSLSIGCGAGFFSASTTATYQINSDGKLISYTSNKEQQGLDLDLQEKDGKVTAVKIHVDKSTTVEQAIAAALHTQLKMMELLEKLAPLIEKAAMAGS